MAPCTEKLKRDGAVLKRPIRSASFFDLRHFALGRESQANSFLELEGAVLTVLVYVVFSYVKKYLQH